MIRKEERNITFFFPSEQYYNNSITSINEQNIESLISFNVDYQYNFTFVEKNETYNSMIDSLSKEFNNFSEIWKDKTSNPKIPIIHLSEDGTNLYAVPFIIANITQSVFKALKEAWFIGAISENIDGDCYIAGNCNNGENKISSYFLILICSFSLITVFYIIQYKRTTYRITSI